MVRVRKIVKMNKITIREGSKIATIGRRGSKTQNGCPVWTGKIYKAKRRIKDGMMIWKLDSYFGAAMAFANFPPQYFCDALRNMISSNPNITCWVPWGTVIRANKPVAKNRFNIEM
jgi:hypothetical protein